jgi:lipid-A-disaccharide synthase
MRLFVSAGEPSGDLHGANLIRCLRTTNPPHLLEVSAFGGERIRGAGATLLYPLSDLALVGIAPVLASIPEFYRILGLARQHFRRHRPDAVVLIDYPGFHWWLADCAREAGIPVVYFVPPQLWAWGGWRARKMRRLVDQVLCTLPFEEAWYRQRHIPARYIGHPYFDELRAQRLDGTFLAQQRARPGTVVALLPGSRNQELRHNVPSLARAAALIHGRRPDVRFLVACLRPEQARQVANQLAGIGAPVEVHSGRTPEIIQLAHSCLAVSGSVSLELLYRGKPAAILYRQHWAGILAARLLMRCKYISLVNLLADRPLFPEYVSAGCTGDRLAEHVLHWLHDRDAYEALCGELAALRQRVAEPGACDRAATAVLEVMQGRARRAA